MLPSDHNQNALNKMKDIRYSGKFRTTTEDESNTWIIVFSILLANYIVFYTENI